MDFRTRRQVVVLSVAAFLILGSGYGVYWAFAPEPTCHDSKKNQNEEEVDCGGPCIPCAFRHQKPIEVFWVRAVKTREHTYDVAAEIRNPNAILGATSFEYEFKLYDTAGIFVASRRGISFIFPGETMHLVEVGVESRRQIRNVAMAIENPEWVAADSIAPDIIAGNRQYLVEEDDGRKSSAVTALVTNRTIRDLVDVITTVLAFNAQGNLLGVHRTTIAELRPGAALAVKWTWPNVFTEPAASIVIEARFNDLRHLEQR